MKSSYIVRALLLASLAFAAVTQSDAQSPTWLPSTGPWTASIFSMHAPSDGRMLAGTSHGLYRKQIDNDSWRLLLPALRDSNIDAVTMTAEGTILVGTSSGSVYRSSAFDDGQYFDVISTDAVNPMDFTVVDSIVYLTSSSGIFRSIDDGRSWSHIDSAMRTQQVMALAPDSLLALTPDTLFLSLDSGTTWTRHNQVELNRARTILHTGADELFVYEERGDNDQTIRRSTDRGVTWTEAMVGLEDNLLGAIGHGRGDDILATTYKGVARWSRANQRWSITAPLELGRVFPRMFVQGADGHVYAGSPDGIHRSTNAGFTWDPVTAGMTSGLTRSIAVGANSTVYADGGYTIWRSINAGDSWQRTRFFGDPQSLVVTAAGTVLVGSFDGIHRSSDAGETWTVDSLGIVGEELNVRTMVVGVDGTVYAMGSRVGLIRSNDDGATWTRSASNISSDFPSALSVGPENHLYVALYDGDIKRSTDRGDSWSTYAQGLSSDVEVIAPMINGDLIYGELNGGIYHYDRIRNEATKISSDNVSGIEDIVVGNDGTILAASWREGGVFRGRIGDPWVSIGSGLAVSGVSDIALDGGNLYAALYGGSVQRTAGNVLSVDRSSSARTAMSVELLRGTDNALVAFTLERAEAVSLVIVNAAGEIAASTSPANFEAGVNRVTMDIATLSSGVYFCELRIGNRRDVARIEVVR